jgi:hypothetical protein
MAWHTKVYKRTRIAENDTLSTNFNKYIKKLHGIPVEKKVKKTP